VRLVRRRNKRRAKARNYPSRFSSVLHSGTLGEICSQRENRQTGKSIMNAYKNKTFSKRSDYECTIRVFCHADSAPSEAWMECSDDELENSNTEFLGSETDSKGTIHWYGYL
jgi:hypothetical protein